MPIYNPQRPMPEFFDALAIAYVKNQPTNSQTYDIKTALIKGTIYPCLDKPFLGKGRCSK